MLAAGKAQPPGIGLDKASFFNANLTLSYSRLPSPPHLHVWRCHANILFARDPLRSRSHRIALQHVLISGRTVISNLAYSNGNPKQ
jgi:hypothetical protein